jgi:hypothetical protein
MADIGVFCKSADIQGMAGIYADATAKAVAATDVYVLNVEAGVCIASGKDWSTNYAALTNNMKLILKETAAAKCASIVIGQNMGGFNSKLEAQSLIDLLLYIYNGNIKLLEQQVKKDLIV